MACYGEHSAVWRSVALLMLLAPMACAPPEPRDTFVPSKRSAVELRSVQTRVVPAPADVAVRSTIATLHDLGYRITKVEPDAGTVSATRQTALRMAVVVRQHGSGQSIVRANATLVSPGREAQVDSADFYRANFFEPLGAMMQRSLADVPPDLAAPEAARPTPEPPLQRLRRAAAPQPAANRIPEQGAPPR